MTRKFRYKTLYYFTESYPYGISEQWKRNELEVFRNYFDRIVVLPRSYGGNPNARNLVDGVEYRTPLIVADAVRGFGEKLKLHASGLLNSRVLKGVTRKAFSKSFLKLLKYSYQVELMKRSPALDEVLRYMDRQPAVLYFYWGIGAADIVPFLPRSDDKIICRFHGWDLYEQRHQNGTIPFRKELIERIDLALSCSDFGARYLADRYPGAAHKIQTARLGTIGRGRSPLIDDGVLKIVTCSSISRVKRLDRLCSALKAITIPVRWTHIGDGELMGEIKELVKGLPLNIVVEFLGNKPSEEVLGVMTSQSYDLLVNVSESEGVPVSIMEAFSAGIPVYATDVGGTSEIVDESVGKLLPSDGDPERIAAELTAFNELAADRRRAMRDAAYTRYEEQCNAHTNAERLAELIISQKGGKRK